MSRPSGDLDSAFRILTEHLGPLVEERMRSAHGDQWESMSRKGTNAVRGNRALDLSSLLHAIQANWHLFRGELDGRCRAYTSEIREVRNDWAHQKAVSEEEVERTLDTISRLLSGIGAEDGVQAIAAIKGGGSNPLNGLVQISRTGRDGIYSEEKIGRAHV
mgnify:CR=1 FL=1